MPFLALGGMFALVALTGSHEDSPLGAPAPARPTKTSWWTEPLDRPITHTETVVVEAQRKEMRGAKLLGATKVTITETVRATVSPTSSRTPATSRNEPPSSVTVSGPPEPADLEPTNPTVPSSESPAPPTSATSEPSVPSDPPTSEEPAPSTPRSETPTPSPEPSEEPEPSLEPSAPVDTSTPVPPVASSVAGS